MGNCNSCPSKGSCSKPPTSCGIENNPNNKIKNIIGVMSGKGGVGKSTITSLIAKKLNKQGYKVGILDADITGPSIPRLMGVHDQKALSSNGVDIYPVITKDNIKTMSINFMVEDESQPVVFKGPMLTSTVQQFYNNVMWEELDYLLIDMPPGTGDVALAVMQNLPVVFKGPMLTSTVQQFYNNVMWEELDYLLIDMPPGTGDVALAVMQNLPITGMIMVSVPQDMISMIVAKGINMAKKLKVNIVGIVENMSYIECPDCGKKIKLFDADDTSKFLDEMNLQLLGELPMTREVIEITHKGVDNISEELDDILTGIVEKIK